MVTYRLNAKPNVNERDQLRAASIVIISPSSAPFVLNAAQIIHGFVVVVGIRISPPAK
jgi:hypothetical protein